MAIRVVGNPRRIRRSQRRKPTPPGVGTVNRKNETAFALTGEAMFFLSEFTVSVHDPNKLLTLTDLALLVNKELGLPPGSPDRSTLWRRINRGVRAKNGTICFLKSSRDGKRSLSSWAFWLAHVREVGLHDELQRNADAGNDTRRRRHLESICQASTQPKPRTSPLLRPDGDGSINSIKTAALIRHAPIASWLSGQ